MILVIGDPVLDQLRVVVAQRGLGADGHQQVGRTPGGRAGKDRPGSPSRRAGRLPATGRSNSGSLTISLPRMASQDETRDGHRSRTPLPRDPHARSRWPGRTSAATWPVPPCVPPACTPGRDITATARPPGRAPQRGTHDQPPRARTAPLHVGIGHRGPSRQDVRPDLGRHPGCHPEQDAEARVACETATTTGLVVVLGEITTSTYVDLSSIVRDTVRGHRLHERRLRLRPATCATIVSVKEQSPDIARGVDVGAGSARRRHRRAMSRRRRPGHDVRLRLRRDAGAHARCPSPWRTGWPAPGRRAQGRLTALTCARTARPR